MKRKLLSDLDIENRCLNNSTELSLFTRQSGNN